MNDLQQTTSQNNQLIMVIKHTMLNKRPSRFRYKVLPSFSPLQNIHSRKHSHNCYHHRRLPPAYFFQTRLYPVHVHTVHTRSPTPSAISFQSILIYPHSHKHILIMMIHSLVHLCMFDIRGIQCPLLQGDCRRKDLQ